MKISPNLDFGERFADGCTHLVDAEGRVDCADLVREESRALARLIAGIPEGGNTGGV